MKISKVVNKDILQTGPAGLPELPAVEIALHRSPGRPSEPVQSLAELIQGNLG